MQFSTTNRTYGSSPSAIYPSTYLPNQKTTTFSMISKTPSAIQPVNPVFRSRTSFNPGTFQKHLSQTQDDKPKGLVNLGNTCYMNSVLQVLFSILNIQSSTSSQNLSLQFTRLRDTHQKQDILKLKAELEKRLDFVKGNDQQDAHEFLRGIVDVLNWEASQGKSKLGFKRPSFNLNMSLSVQENWRKFTESLGTINDTNIVRVFAGETLTDIVSQAGNYNHYTFDRFLDVTLNFPSVDRTYHIKDLLNYEFRPELLDGIYFDECKKKLPSIKTVYFYKLPQILVIHINRFYIGTTTNSKIISQIEFDQELEIPQKLLHDDLKGLAPKYELIGIVHHVGGLNYGHYYGDVKGESGKWYRCNDETVNEIPMLKKGNLSQQAYMLFYSIANP